MDQITQKLELGILEPVETQDLQADQSADLKLSSPPIDIKVNLWLIVHPFFEEYFLLPHCHLYVPELLQF